MDHTVRKSEIASDEDDEDESELEQAMMKRSEIRMRDRSQDDLHGNNRESFRQSVVGFGGLFTSQTNMDSIVN